MDEKLQELRDRQLELNQEATGLVARADTEGRDPTDDELTRLQEIEVESAKLGKQIDARVAIARRQADLGPQGRRTEASPVGRDDDRPSAGGSGGRHPMGTPVRPAAEPRGGDGRCGYRNLGEFAGSVRHACLRVGQIDRRLEQLAPTSGSYASEATGSDGGFLVPPDFRQAIMSKVFGQDSLIDRTSKLVTSGNSVSVPADEASPWGGTGVQAYWTGEAQQLRASKPVIRKTQFDIHKLTALVAVTDELLSDAPALDAYLKQKAPQAIDWKTNDALLRGTGAGMPLGVLNSPAKVRAAKVPGQAADTVVYANVLAMWSRLYGPSRKSAVWLCNQDVEPQLAQMYLAAGSTGFPVYLPPGGVSGAPYSTLYGRPVLPVENCSQLGDEGDLVLVDWSQYVTVTQVEKLKQEMSIHLYFDYDLVAFRWIIRLGGQPWWSAPIARQNGSNTLSCIVTLEDRA